MMEFVRYIFEDFWHFAGFIFILLIVCGSPIVSINHYHHKDDDNDV